MLIRAYVRSQGKGSYKHKALISSGSYLLNEEKGAKKKALISMQALIKVGSYKHTTTVLLQVFTNYQVTAFHLKPFTKQAQKWRMYNCLLNSI